MGLQTILKREIASGKSFSISLQHWVTNDNL